MPYLSKKRVWTQQPQVALPLNTGSSLTNGLIFATDSTGRDVISGVMPKFLGSGKRSLKKEGYALESPDTSSSGIYWELPADHPLYSIGTQDTTFVKAHISAKVAYGAFIGVPYRSGAWASPYFAWGLILGDDAVSAYHWTGSGAFYTRVLSSYFNTVGTTISYCVSRDGLTAYFYKNNTLIGSGYNSDSSAPSFTNKQPLCLFNQSNTASDAVLNAYAPEIRVYNRVLSDIERAALHENPQIIFRPDDSRIWVPSAGGGSSTNLIIQDSTHSLLSDNLDLSTSLLLTIQDSTHSLTSDNLILNTTGSTDLTIQEATHSVTSDNLLITTEWLLDIASAAHALTSDNLDLSTALSIIIQNAIHSHTADNLVLDTSNTTFLTIQDAVHNHTADNLDLTLDTWLVIANAVHSHLADSIDLGTELTLTIQDSTHNLTSDIIILSIPSTGSCPTVEEIVAAIMIQIEAKNYLTLPQFLSFK